jgi:WD40 repeat protein
MMNLARFAPDGSVICTEPRGIVRLVLPETPDGALSSEVLFPADGKKVNFALSRDGRQLLVMSTSRAEYDFDELSVVDLSTRATRQITTHGTRLFHAVFDPTGQYIVTAGHDGIVRVGPVTGEEPHLLLGHTGLVGSLAVSPDGRWIASAAGNQLFLWPMPDMTKPPLHTLPHDELVAKLEMLTNLRVVPDASAASGWKLDVGPFPGWKDVPAL